MAAGNGKFTLSVMNEKGVLYYGDCNAVFVPSAKGETAIIAHHTPMIMQMVPGVVHMELNHTKRHLADAKSGVAYVAEDKVIILVDL